MLKTTLNIFTLSSLWFENMSMLGLKYVDVLTLLGYSLLQMQRFIDVSFLCYLQIQIIGYNSELCNNMSHAQVSSNGIVIISLLAQVKDF